jgi:hypothetical protein
MTTGRAGRSRVECSEQGVALGEIVGHEPWSLSGRGGKEI